MKRLSRDEMKKVLGGVSPDAFHWTCYVHDPGSPGGYLDISCWPDDPSAHCLYMSDCTIGNACVGDQNCQNF